MLIYFNLNEFNSMPFCDSKLIECWKTYSGVQNFETPPKNEILKGLPQLGAMCIKSPNIFSLCDPCQNNTII